MLGPTFAVVWRGEEALDDLAIGVRRKVLLESAQLLGRRWQTGQIQGDASQQRRPIRRRRGVETDPFQPIQHQTVYR